MTCISLHGSLSIHVTNDGSRLIAVKHVPTRAWWLHLRDATRRHERVEISYFSPLYIAVNSAARIPNAEPLSADRLKNIGACRCIYTVARVINIYRSNIVFVFSRLSAITRSIYAAALFICCVLFIFQNMYTRRGSCASAEGRKWNFLALSLSLSIAKNESS